LFVLLRPAVLLLRPAVLLLRPAALLLLLPLRPDALTRPNLFTTPLRPLAQFPRQPIYLVPMLGRSLMGTELASGTLPKGHLLWDYRGV